MTALESARVLVGVGGGIAAYKTAHLVRGLVASGADVRVVPTAASLEFVGRATWEALSHHEVLTDVFERVEEVAHVRHGQLADAVVIAPATADLLARLRAGRADDMLTASVLMARCPVVLAPAMHTEMWTHPATQENVRVLRERGAIVLEPAVGRLTGPDSGPGRLPEPDAILAATLAAVAAPRTADGGVLRDLDGRRIIVTAGGTREAIDPVRYLANRSSGLQGFALAQAALARGATVTLIAANAELDTPPGADRRDVSSAAELGDAVDGALADGADALIMAAAVADFAPAETASAKIKKSDDPADGAPALRLERTRDVLRTVVAAREEDPGRGPRVIVGFAAETGDPTASALEHAQAKARRKRADLLVHNDVSGGVFGGADNAVALLDGEGAVLGERAGTKTEVAHAVLDAVSARLRDVPWSA